MLDPYRDRPPEGTGVMKWPATIKTVCAACDHRFPIPTADLLSLEAVCPGCGASLASAGEEHLRWSAGYRREIDLFMVGYELQTAAGVELSDSEVFAARSLEDLTCAVAGRLPPAADREARAVELVTQTARQVAPDLLLDGAEYVRRVMQSERAWWRSRPRGQAGPGAAVDRPRDPGSSDSKPPSAEPGIQPEKRDTEVG
jgi:hypothetical protein